jgi:hypothetical protein
MSKVASPIFVFVVVIACAGCTTTNEPVVTLGQELYRKGIPMVVSAEEAYLHFHVINASTIDPNPIDPATPGVYRALPPVLQKARLPRGTRVTLLEKGPIWSQVMWYNRKIPAWYPGKVYTKDLSPISRSHAGNKAHIQRWPSCVIFPGSVSRAVARRTSDSV